MRWRLAGMALGWTIVVGLLAPVLFTLWVSFSPDSFMTPPVGEWSTRWYRTFLHDRRWSAATMRSIIVAISSAVFSVATAAPAAVAAHRAMTRDRRFLTACLMLPAIIPPAALGTGLLPLVHAVHLWGTNLGMVIVHTALGLPIAVLIIQIYLTDELRELEAAARGLGANSWQVTRRVTLPLLSPAFAAAGVAVFVLSLNESLVSLFLATPDNETLPAVIWPQLRYSASPLVAVASCVTTVLGVAGAICVTRIIGWKTSTSSDER